MTLTESTRGNSDTAPRPDPYLERLNKEIKRRTNVVGIFPNDASVLRLITAVVVETHAEWQVTGRRYLSEDSMAKLYATDNTVSNTLPEAPSPSPPDHLDPAEHHAPANSTYTSLRDSIHGSASCTSVTCSAQGQAHRSPGRSCVPCGERAG